MVPEIITRWWIPFVPARKTVTAYCGTYHLMGGWFFTRKYCSTWYFENMKS